MPTAKPRITVTLEPRTYEVLSRLSAAGGDSMSQIVSEFVQLALPSLERLVVVLERARSAPQEVRSGLLASIERAERTALPAMQAIAGIQDMFLADIEHEAPEAPAAEPGARRASSGASGSAKTPRPVTRGVGSGKTRRLSVKGG